MDRAVSSEVKSGSQATFGTGAVVKERSGRSSTTDRKSRGDCALTMENIMAATDQVEGRKASEDFRKQVLGYGLTTAEILYRMPDHPSLLQSFVWQNYDLFPKFPVLKDFLAFWQSSLDGPVVSVTVAHCKLIKPAELRAVDGVFRLH
jgi:uncharacterized protein Usg